MSSVLVKRLFIILKADLSKAILNSVWVSCVLHHLLSCYENSLNIPHSSAVFDLCYSVNVIIVFCVLTATCFSLLPFVPLILQIEIAIGWVRTRKFHLIPCEMLFCEETSKHSILFGGSC
jgi:hypothetical protein